MYSRLLRMQRKHSSTPGSINLKQRCVIYCIYDHSGQTDHMYIGVTHGSARTRYHELIAAARQWARRPAAARNVFHKGHRLYHTWARRGLKDFAIFPLEILMADHTLCGSKQFGRRCAEREAFWIDILKTLTPRGYNVRNDRPTHRQANMLNNARRRQRKAAAALASSTATGSSEASSVQPPTPHTAPAPGVGPAAHPIPPLSSHDTTAVMSGGLRNSSYARTAHALLQCIVRLQVSEAGLDLSQALDPNHPLITYLSSMRNKHLEHGHSCGTQHLPG